MSVKRSRSTENGGFQIGRLIWGGLIGIVLMLLLIFAASYAISREWLPFESPWLAPVTGAVSAFFSACVATRHNSKKLLCGLISANLAWLTVLICGMLLFSAPMASGRLVLTTVTVQLGAFSGAVLSGLKE